MLTRADSAAVLWELSAIQGRRIVGKLQAASKQGSQCNMLDGW